MQSKRLQTAVKRGLVLCVVAGAAAPVAASAQVAPAPAAVAAPPASTPSFKAGWIAQVVSYKNGVVGEVPLATSIVGAAQDDLFVRAGTSGNEAGLVLRGWINAPEAGRYGFLVTLASTVPQSACKYSFAIDGTELMSGRGPLMNNIGGDKAVDLTAGRHPAELRVACSSGLPKIRVSLKAKLPSADQVAPLSNDFIVHQTRASGD